MSIRGYNTRNNICPVKKKTKTKNNITPRYLKTWKLTKMAGRAARNVKTWKPTKMAGRARNVKIVSIRNDSINKAQTSH